MGQRVEAQLLDPSAPDDGNAIKTPTFTEVVGSDSYTHRGLDVSIISGDLSVTSLNVDVNILGDAFDFDTSAGTDMREMIGIVVPASGGGQVAGVNETPFIVEDKVPQVLDGGELTCTPVNTEVNITANEAYTKLRKVTILPHPDPVQCAGEITLVVNGHDADPMYAGDVAQIIVDDLTQIGVKSDNNGDVVRWRLEADTDT